jgi:hypothetical protein
LYLRAPAHSPYTFSGRALGGATEKYKDIFALAVDSRGNVFVGQKMAVLVFNAKGEFARSIPAADPSALFINIHGAPVVVRKNFLQPENAQLVSLMIPQPGAPPKSVDEIPAALETSRGDWLVSDRKGKAILLFSAGKYVKSLLTGVEAERLAFNGLDDVAILDRENKAVLVADRDGKLVRRISARGEGYALENPVDLAFDPFGHLYVLDREKASVFVFTPEGKLAASFTVAEKSPGAFQKAVALGLDSAARLYIFDERAQRVQVYQ